MPLLAVFSTAAASAPNPAEVEFFEKKIRPVLVRNCYECHSQKSAKIKGGLLLDSRDDVLKGGNSGPAVVPRNPDASLLIRAVRYADKALRMPPKNKRLPPAQVADLETWVKMGAPDPRVGAAANDPDSYWSRARKHWAFRPIEPPPLPRVKTVGWARTPVDSFVLAAMEAHGLSPSPAADKRTLIRRATYDLIGLPPTPEETAEFLRDDSPNAFARVVDRLLASPAYGERWGRHWLDVARYSDTKGYVSNESDNRYFYAYTYRDYVIRAFNEDLPYDRFLIEQITADQVPRRNERTLAALGFLTVGKRHLNVQNDIIDDRIDVVTRGLMGLTVACARCHDHKYDPIPTRDYYALFGVFANSTEPAELPTLEPTQGNKDYAAFEKARKEREDALKAYRKAREDEQLTILRQRTGDYLLTAYEVQKLTSKLDQDQLTLERKLDLGVRQRWQDTLREATVKHDPMFAPWAVLAAVPENQFAARAKELAAKSASDAARPVNPLVVRALFAAPLTSFKQVIDRYGSLFAAVDGRWQELVAKHAKTGARVATTALPDPNEEAIRQLLYGPKGPPNLPRDQLERFFDKPTKHHLIQLQLDINDVIAGHPGSPDRALVLNDVPAPQPTRIFLQGDPGKQGAEVPRQFLGIVSGADSKPFPPKTSGRLQLAQAIASRDNPLTARVVVNRVWQHHFGAGLVRTPSDFGVRADPPTHPEMLDYLAWRFMEDGWSIKKLHRLVLLSAVYQQSCGEEGQVAALPVESRASWQLDPRARIDPENQWLWRMNRRRLDFESLRDSLLAVSGALDRHMYGRPVDLTAPPLPARRAVYGLVDRLDFPDLLRTFDVPIPDKTIAQRPLTTVPQQALFFLNDRLVVEQARNLAARPDFQENAGEESRMRWLYQRVYQREPLPEEVRLAREFLKGQSALPAQAPVDTPAEFGWQYGSGEYDPAGRVRNFQPLSCLAGDAWQAGAQATPDEVRLTADGGTAGKDPRHSAIRRWVAPQDGLLRITGTLARNSGTVARGHLVSSRAGVVGSWTVQQGPAETRVEPVEVKRGDVLDFVVEGPGGAFSWAPQIRIIDVPPGEIAGVESRWDARTDFRGPPRPLTAWEKYAQVLLMANEFAYDR